MICIIPALEVWRAVVDNNMQSAGSRIRRESFNESINLKTLVNLEIILDSKIYKRILPRLENIHKDMIEKICRISKATEDIPDYNTVESVNGIAKIEAQVNKVMVLTENKNNYAVTDGKVHTITPIEFLNGIKTFKDFINDPIAKDFIEKQGKAIYDILLDKILF